jgi:hypothetical protein
LISSGDSTRHCDDFREEGILVARHPDDRLADPTPSASRQADPVLRVTRVLLLILISPALLLTLAVGGTIVLAGKIARMTTRVFALDGKVVARRGRDTPVVAIGPGRRAG